MLSIQLSNVGKSYRVYPNQWARLLEWLFPFLGTRHNRAEVLQAVSFTVAPGEAVGLIGRNGAGKSTLLKIITGTTRQSTGEVKLHGRVAALLELGMGFHPDFTGRQNLYTAGQLMGFSEAEITTMMPSIEAFAEIGEFIDRQVRVYSSGMQVRLAFSLATAIRPDILIVDEALSVGDAYFQHKSFDRIRQFKAQGSTLILVSHDSAAIQAICDRSILLDNGRVVRDGDPHSVLEYYNALVANSTNIGEASTCSGMIATTSGNARAQVASIRLETADHPDAEVVFIGQWVSLVIDVESLDDVEALVCGYAIKNRLGQDIYGTNTFHFQQQVTQLAVGTRVRYSFKFPVNLNAGEYSIATALTAGETHLEGNYEWKSLAKVFTVVNSGIKPFTGFVWLEPSVTVEVDQ